MPCDILVGTQWGDEGKAKIIDFLCDKSDIIVRFQGGANAGHTVYLNGEKYVFHLVPSGILHPEKTCLIGSGVVVDPVALFSEIDHIRQRGIDTDGRILVCGTAHVILPYHKILDSAMELFEGSGKIGTTGKGIGPAYTFKASRKGIRCYDIVQGTFAERIKTNIEEINSQLEHYYRNTTEIQKNPELAAFFDSKGISADKIIAQCEEMRPRLKEMICDGSLLVSEAIKAGKTVLAEGAQGTGLDINFGTYPFVTSSNPTAGGACTGIGIGPTQIRNVYGIIKGYTTRVGEGPFPTELNDAEGELLRATGGEFGATTGRPRRCGWLDGVFARYACRINSLTDLILTKLDVLDDFKEIKFCTGYTINGETTRDYQCDAKVLSKVVPEYRTFPGWCSSTKHAKNYSQLPKAAREYLEFVEDFLGVRISIISVGAGRDETIIR